MAVRHFGFDLPLPASLIAFGNAARLLARVRIPAGRLARLITGARRRVAEHRRLSYLDDRALNDIGLRRDDFARVAHDRLQEWIMRYHF
jgi:uncharacterized protein YjiS (DUF1127 family)